MSHPSAEWYLKVGVGVGEAGGEWWKLFWAIKPRIEIALGPRSIIANEDFMNTRHYHFSIEDNNFGQTKLI